MSRLARSKSKLPSLDYQQQNHIQNVAIAHGTLLSEAQMKQFASYKADKAFVKSTDAQLLYLVMTPAQRAAFDRTRFE